MRSLLLIGIAGLLAGQTRGEDERLERVLRLAAEASPAACKALVDTLVDESFDLRSRAASALYWKCERNAAANYTAQLCRSIELGNPEAGAALLLGYAKPDEGTPCLRKAARRPDMVKLAVSAQPVPIGLPVQVALARLKDPAATRELRREFNKPSEQTALFLLGVLRDIEDRDALRAAVGLLDDERPGPGVVAHATRRIRDITLEALVARLSIKPPFAIEPGKRYGARELAEVRTLAERALAEPVKPR
jgi:HEAT repeat protein